MAKYQIPNRTFIERLASCIPGSEFETESNLIIPQIKVAIVITFRRPNQYDTFSMFHYNNSGIDRFFLDTVMIPPENPYPIDYVASFCMQTLIDHYFGYYIEDIEFPSICEEYWNKIMKDEYAESAFSSKGR